MNFRAWLGTVIWVVGFNLCVALIAIDLGVGWAVSILCLHYILLGIPRVYSGWRRLIVGSQSAIKMPELAVKEWPNRKWLIEMIACVCLSLVIIIWFNFPLGELLFGM